MATCYDGAMTAPPARSSAQLAALAAMGIPVYVARRPVPGAARSSRHAAQLLCAAEARTGERGVGAPPEPDAASVNPVVPQSRTRAPTLPRVHEPRTSEPRRPPRPAAPSSSTPERTPQDAFEIAIFRTGELLWMEELEVGVLARAQLTLVAAMARAATGFSGTPQPIPFRWPPAQGLRVPLGPEAAGLALASFVARQVDESGCCLSLVLLGSAVFQRTEGLFDLPTVQLPSTRAMLATPRLKAEAWRTLRTIRGPGDGGK